MALLFSLMVVAADGFSSDGVLLKDASESELVGMDDRLDMEGNWLRMFPVSSLIWEERAKTELHSPPILIRSDSSRKWLKHKSRRKI